MDESKSNLNNDQQDCACTLPNDSTTCNTGSPTKQVVMDQQECKITIEANNDQLLLDGNVCTEFVKNQEITCSVRESENITDEVLKKNISSSNVDNPSCQVSAIQSTTMDTLNDTASKDLEEHKGSLREDNAGVKPNNKVAPPEEVHPIEIDSEHSTDFINRKNLKNLSNQHSSLGDLYYIDANNSLGAIAFDYDSTGSSESDYEDEISTKITDHQKYRSNNEVVITSDKSSDSESDSSSSESESDSESSSSESENDDGSDNEQKNKNKNKGPKNPVKPTSEFDNLPPIEDLKISVPEVLCDPLGEVAWMVEQMVVVCPKKGKPTLNLDTVLFIEKGKRALGHIFDVFGQVSDPHYCVRFNSSEHIKESDIKKGMTVYYCPNTAYTSLVFLSEITKMKAADDVGDDEAPEFSDDEEEQAYLASLKNKTKIDKKSAPGENTSKRRRGNKSVWQSKHPWSSNSDMNNHSQNPQPFYRTHHPWSRQRFQPQHQPYPRYNPYPYNYFNPQHSLQPNFRNHSQMPPMEMPNVGFPQLPWVPSQYPVPQWNHVTPHEIQQTPAPLISLPPPPPPPPPSASSSKKDDQHL